MTADLPEVLRKRVSEQAVARVLEVLSTLPNRRETPRAGDRAGSFDYWFDGGACRVQTGVMEFELDDGTVVRVGGPMLALSLSIRFPDGRRVRIQQESSGSEDRTR